MASLKQELEGRLHRAAHAIEKAFDRSREKIGGAFAPTVEDAQHIAAYRGYATGEKLVVSGRVLANPSVDEAEDDDNWWKNLGGLWQRVNSREVAGAEVLLRYQQEERVAVTDNEGYYQYEFELRPGESDGGHEFWTAVDAAVPDASSEVAAQG